MDPRSIDIYFNKTLRDHLRYPETFKLQFYKNAIRLLPQGLGTGGIVLLELIKTNLNFRNQLFETITNIIGHHIELRSDGKIITILIKGKKYTFEDIPPDVSVYANIASNFNMKDLENFCSSNQVLRDVCQRDHFWIQLIKERFPKFTSSEVESVYRWKEIYLGLLYIDENTEGVEYLFDYKNLNFQSRKLLENKWNYLLDNYFELLKYLNDENIVPFTRSQILNIIKISKNVGLIDSILDNFLLQNDELLEIFGLSIGYPELMKLYIDYKETGGTDGVDILLQPSEVNIKYSASVYKRNSLIDIESFKIFHNFVTQGDASVEEILGDLTVINDIKVYTSPEVLDYFREILSDDLKDEDVRNIKEWISESSDFIRYDNPQVYKMVWTKYSYLFSPEEIFKLKVRIENQTLTTSEEVKKRYLDIINYRS